MKKTIPLFAAICLLLFACKKEDTNADPFQITNPSFELNGSFSTSDWLTGGAASSTDIPPGGGSFSLKLSPGSFPDEGHADYVIDGVTGTHVLTLTTYIKSFDSWPGSVSLKKVTSAGISTILGSAGSDSSEWNQLTINTTVTLNVGDELVIHLSAGSSEIPITTQYNLFDLVTLKED